MSVSGLRDISVMNSPPQGRLEVKVQAGELWNNATVVSAIEYELARGGQVFVVVPFIADCETMSNTLRELMPSVSCIVANGAHADLENRIDRFKRKEVLIMPILSYFQNLFVSMYKYCVVIIMIFSNYLFI